MAITLANARPVLVPTDRNYQLDVDALAAAITPRTRAIVTVSPNNPTGWTLDLEARDAIQAHCRRLGVWIIEDNAYERLYYREGALAAPSFLDMLTALRRAGWQRALSAAAWPPRRRQNAGTAWPDAVLATT